MPVLSLEDNTEEGEDAKDFKSKEATLREPYPKNCHFTISCKLKVDMNPFIDKMRVNPSRKSCKAIAGYIVKESVPFQSNWR